MGYFPVEISMNLSLFCMWQPLYSPSIFFLSISTSFETGYQWCLKDGF